MNAGARGREGRRLHDLADLRVVAVVVVVRRVDAQESADPLTLDSLHTDRDTLDTECRGHAPERLELGSSVEKSGEQHVPCKPPTQSRYATLLTHDPARCGPRSSRRRAPSSIPTTASPAAQEASMALSAVDPPWADP